MKLINNQHFINLEPFLDIASLDLLHDQISYAIGKSADYISPASPPAYSFSNTGLVAHLDLKAKLRTTNPELTNNQLDWYTLMKGAASHGYALFLKNIKKYPDDFRYKSLESHTVKTPAGLNFDFLFEWIEKQNCFTEYGRVLFFISPPGSDGIVHRDNKGLDEYVDQLIWVTGKFPKKLFLFDTETEEKVECPYRAMYFMNHNYHGTYNPSDYWSWSLRVDGVFTEEFKQKAGLSDYFNRLSGNLNSPIS